MARARKSPINKKPPPRAAFAVRFFGITDWPTIEDGQALVVPRHAQQPLEPDQGGAPRTVFDPNPQWRVAGFEKLDVVHERSRHGYHSPFYDQDWRVRTEIVNSLIERYRFTAYLPANRRGIYVRANSMVANGALRRVKESYGTAYEPRSVDVKKFIYCLQTSVSKAWWKEMRLPNVQSASLAGPNVHRSSDFARFMDEGELSAAVLSVEWDNLKYRVMVSDKNTIFFHMEDEARAISLAAHVNQLLESCPDVLGAIGLARTVRPAVNGDQDDGDDEDEPEMAIGFGMQELPLNER